MKILVADSVQARAVEQLGLDPSVLNLTSSEAIAATLRRVASFSCPCSAAHLVTTAFELLSIVVGATLTREVINDSLEALISFGDLFESQDVTGRSSSQLVYLTPPSFVQVSSNLILLAGGGPEAQYPLPVQFAALVEPVNHYRRLSVERADEAAKELLHAAFLRIEVNEWLKAPPQLTPEAHLSRYESFLTPVGPVGTLEGITVLETGRPVNYYRGRWTPLKTQSGKYVARRPQAYGADLWCYMQLDKGEVRWFVDLPLLETRWRGCDEAWHLQQAIDSMSKHAQVYRLRQGTKKGTIVVDLFSPVPRWASRRWDYAGTPATAANCLFSYVFPEDRLADELAFAHERMWLLPL